jgi:MraZ protein
MARLINRYDQTIDDKGRLVLPAAHRERYEAGAVLANRGDHLAVYEPREWDHFVEQLRDARIAGNISRTQFNLVTMNAADPKPDSAGRILIPSWMREAVGLGKDVLVGGVHEYLAIYPNTHLDDIDPHEWESASQAIDALGL